MDEKSLFYKVLGLHPPWWIKEVVLDEAEQRVDIYIDHESGIQVRCPECDKFYGLYDHSPGKSLSPFEHLPDGYLYSCPTAAG